MKLMMTRTPYRLLLLAPLLLSLGGRLWAQENHDSTVFVSFSVTFWVQDVRRSAQFYHDSLGLPLVNYLIGRAQETTTLQPSDSPYAAIFSVGDRSLHLQAANGQVHPSGARYSFGVSDPVAYAKLLKARGVRIEVIAADSTGAPGWFTVVDPDGRRLEFLGQRRKH